MPRSNTSVKKYTNKELLKSNEYHNTLQTQAQPQQPQLLQKQNVSIGNSIKEGVGLGFGYGLGSSFAEKTMNMFFSNTKEHPTINPKDMYIDFKYKSENTEYNKCMESHNDKFYCDDIIKNMINNHTDNDS